MACVDYKGQDCYLYKWKVSVKMFLLYTNPHRLSNTHESMLGNK